MDAQGKAAELRRAFDRAFAEAPAGARAREEDLLALRVGGDPYAIRLADIAGLIGDKPITRVPSPAADLLGVIGLRGAVVPVYALGAWLGHAIARGPRWIVLVGEGAAAVGLAFDDLEGHRRVAAGAIVAHGTAIAHVRELARDDAGVSRPVVDVRAIAGAIARQARPEAGSTAKPGE